MNVSAVPPTAPALGSLWRGLQERGGVGTPFLTWEWFSALADNPELSRTVEVLVAHDSAGRPVGLFPVAVDRGPAGARIVRCAGTETLGADHLDVVALPAHRGAVAAAIARHVARSLNWDLAGLEGLTADGALARALQAALRPPRFLLRPAQLEPVPVVDFRGAGGDAVRARLRRRSARGLKHAERAGGGFEVVEDPARVGALMESLMDMHNERFGGQSSVFSTPALRTFHVTAARRLAEGGFARIGRLSTSSEDIALEYVLLMGDRAYSYQSGFRPDGGHSPGRTAMCQAMLVAAEEGRQEYDLLRGDESYKADYATGTRPDVHLRAVRPTVRGAAWAADRVLALGRQRLRRPRSVRAGASSGVG